MPNNYFRLAIRNCWKQKWYTATNVIGLSLGITGGLLLFQFITFHLGFDRYHRKADQIYRVVTSLQFPDHSITNEAGAPLDIGVALKEQLPEVSDQAFLLKIPAVTVGVPSITTGERRFFREKNNVAYVDEHWFKLFDHEWLNGDPSNSLREAHMAVITRSMANRYFGAADPIGKLISLEDTFNVRITGVLADPPANTDMSIGLFLSRPSFASWHPDIERNMHQSWGFINNSGQAYVLLSSVPSAGKIDQTMTRLKEQHFSSDVRSAYQFQLQPLREIHFDARFGGVMNRSLLVTLAIIGSFLVLIACFNFINLATAQSSKRSREIGTRKVLGGTAASIFWQFMTETAFIVLLSSALAVGLCNMSLPVFRSWLQTPVPFDILRDKRLLSFLLLLILFVTLTAGAYPAMVLSRWRPVSALKQEIAGSVTAVFRKALVVLQHVIVQALIICTIIITLQIRYMKNADPGFNKESVMMVPLPDTNASTLSWLKQRLAADPGVRSLSFCYSAPLTQETWMAGSVSYDARAWEDFAARTIPADSNYLTTFRLRLLAGRNIRSGGSGASGNGGYQEALINETLLHKFGFHDAQQVIGHRIVNGSLGDLACTIVGVVKDFNVKPLYGGLEPVMIVPFTRRYHFTAIKLEGGRKQNEVRASIQKIWQTAFPDNAYEYHFVDEEIDSFYHKDDLLSKLVDVTAFVAILISCLGLSGLISFFAERRTREIGIRKVLGASVPNIVVLLCKDFLVLVAGALLIAVPVAWYFMHMWLQHFFYRIDVGWWVFALAGMLSAVITLSTVGYRSLRAAMVNPVNSIKV